MIQCRILSYIEDNLDLQDLDIVKNFDVKSRIFCAT